MHIIYFGDNKLKIYRYNNNGCFNFFQQCTKRRSDLRPHDTPEEHEEHVLKLYAERARYTTLRTTETGLVIVRFAKEK